MKTKDRTVPRRRADGIWVYFDELKTEKYPKGAWAATYFDPSEGADKAYADTQRQAVINLKKGKFGE